jgi:hypothetical protein
MMSFPTGTLRRFEFANKAIADELPVLHCRSAIIGDPESLLRVIRDRVEPSAGQAMSALPRKPTSHCIAGKCRDVHKTGKTKTEPRGYKT